MIGSNKNELRPDEKPQYVASTPFFILQLSGFAGLYYVFSDWRVALTCAVLYYSRMFVVTGFLHRYFSHGSFKINGGETTKRVVQFLMVVATATTVQNGALWWASHHRHHHQHSDEDEDIHSCYLKGFFWSHVGWILCGKFKQTNWKKVRDLSRYPELVMMNRRVYYTIPAAALALGCWYFGGIPYLIGRFATSTFLLFHGTASINSVAHMCGSQRFPETGDQSRNWWVLNILTLGEGWHNNHHHQPQYEAQAITWQEKLTDVTHWVLWLVSKTGLITLRSREELPLAA